MPPLSIPADQYLRLSDKSQVRCYRSHFSDRMEMLAPLKNVAEYLDHHQGWFQRCAAPMEVKALDDQSYLLTLGRFGNFGFEVEPCIGLKLLPQQQGLYQIINVDLRHQDLPLCDHYDVDFKAGLKLEPSETEASNTVQQTTIVNWDLDLSVWIQLPKVITLLPDGLVQTSGDQLLRQIVRQISRRLTWKVQEDFHATH
ncbi:MAG: DUF1997 domain-containing protein, partial [Cyanobacteriota bacterium]|nr:DUF1997 domain-containing protein [Cyanobacteriota bacterium]